MRASAIPRVRFALAGLAAALVATSTPAGAGNGHRPADCVLGPEDPRLAGWRRAVDEACRTARPQVEARLGLSAPSDARIRCVVATREERRLPYDDWRFATTSTLPDGSVEVFFAAEALATGSVRLPQTAVHEMTHGVMRAAMGGAYNAVDPWFREGVAVWVAGQGEDRVHSAFARAIHAGRGAPPRVEALLDGLATEPGEPHGADNYAEDYLAFAWLEARRGAGAVGDAVRRVAGGADPLEAVAAAGGAPEGEGMARIDAFSRERLLRTAARLHASGMRRCGRDLQRGRTEEAAACFERTVARHPGSPLDAVARMLGAVAWQRADQPVRARHLLAVVAAGTSPFADEAHQRIAHSLEQEGRPAAAFDAACAALRDGYTRHAPHLAFIAGRSLLRLDRPRDAVPWLERVLDRYPASAHEESAARLLGEARRSLEAAGPGARTPDGAVRKDADGGGEVPAAQGQ